MVAVAHVQFHALVHAEENVQLHVRTIAESLILEDVLHALPFVRELAVELARARAEEVVMAPVPVLRPTIQRETEVSVGTLASVNATNTRTTP